METPSSTRVTKSHISATSVSVSKNTEDSKSGVSKSSQRNGKQQDRRVLIDVTNDSPIVGVAGNLEMPLSSSKASRAKKTPASASGEALLRGQVKTLLQKVEEEAELSKLSLESRPFLQLVNSSSSPMALLAPTPANTPQILSFSGDGVPHSPVVEEQLISQVVKYMCEGKKEEENVITRSLLMDFSEKTTETCDASESFNELSYEEEIGSNSTKDIDDVSSNWSLQVNASSTKDEQEEEDNEEGEEDIEEEEDSDEMLKKLCKGMNKMSVKNVKWEGKHTRFVYNSDDEIVDEEEDCVSPNVIRLKGLPTPKGKHLRFTEE